jgi:cysteine desulfurase/selenocysteine lyase
MSAAHADTAPYDVDRVRRDFPILGKTMHGKPLAYLDSASSAQKPRAVTEAMTHLFEHHYANVHRGVYQLSATSTRLYAEAREAVARLLGAGTAEEVIFTRNTTESINLVAASWGRRNLQPGDEVVLTEMEHHSNIVPWQLICEERGARIRVAPVDDRGALRMEELERLVGGSTKLVAIAHVSNVLGTINPVRAVSEIAHRCGALVLVDGAQAAPRLPVDLQQLDCDFYACSGHKLYGPNGVGVLWGRAELLDAMPPFLGGGGMIESVTFEKTTYAPVPERFEAGTPDVGCAVGLRAAIEYVEALGLGDIARHEDALLGYATTLLEDIPGLRLIGTAPEKTGVLSFVVDGIHPHDIGTVLDREGVAIRVGHHCAQPLMNRFGVPATARASLGLYNDRGDVDRLAAGIRSALEIFA